MARVENENGILDASRIYLDEIQPGDRFGYKITAMVFEGIEGWCAYRAPLEWSDDRACAEGDEIDERAAKLLFPTLDALGYKYGNF